eukprot:m.185205 g.185205  ORF g.185205 m.185205 type:complete len:252 (-) comp14727_c0_seq1:36-791(-)
MTGSVWLAAVCLAVCAATCLSASALAENDLAAALPLPNELVAFNTSEGRHLLLQANDNGHAECFWDLSMQYVTQETQTYCSIATLTIMLNAISVSAPIDPVYSPFPYYTQNAIFTPCVNALVNKTVLAKQGATLQQAASIPTCFKVATKATHAADSSLDSFRRALMEATGSKNTFLAVNFLRATLDEAGEGHFSPVGAYDMKRDMALVMDVARYKYPAFWAPVETLFNSLNTTDSASNLSRGWVILQPAAE